MKQHRFNWDALGIGASLLCAIHCAVLPLIFTSLPLFGTNIIHNHYFEWFMIALAFVVGYYSLNHGFKKHHRSRLPFLVFSAGMVCLIIRMFIPALETIMLFPAVLLIVGAHIYNYKLCNSCNSKSCSHAH